MSEKIELNEAEKAVLEVCKACASSQPVDGNNTIVDLYERLLAKVLELHQPIHP